MCLSAREPRKDIAPRHPEGATKNIFRFPDFSPIPGQTNPDYHGFIPIFSQFFASLTNRMLV